MPEVSQVMFKHQEVLEALIKKAGLHDGKWQLIVTFGFSGMNLGPSDAEMNPAAAVVITGIGLQKAAPESPPSLTLDAAVINPASTSRQRPS
jgi:hypothetical protein